MTMYDSQKVLVLPFSAAAASFCLSGVQPSVKHRCQCIVDCELTGYFLVHLSHSFTDVDTMTLLPSIIPAYALMSPCIKQKPSVVSGRDTPLVPCKTRALKCCLLAYRDAFNLFDKGGSSSSILRSSARIHVVLHPSDRQKQTAAVR